VPHLPLRGADLVLLGLAWRSSKAVNNGLLAVEADGPIAAPRVRHALDRLLDHAPWPAARLQRPFPWGGLRWAADVRTALVPPPIAEHSLVGGQTLREFLESRLSTPIDPWREAPLRLDLVHDAPGTRGTVLSMTWSRPLMDAKGAEGVVMRLARLDEDPTTTLPDPAGPPQKPLPLRERGRLGRMAQARMRKLAPEPPVSAGSQARSTRSCRFLRRVYESSPGEQRLDKEMSFRLAVTAKAMADLWRRRRLPEVPFLVPVTIDQRRMGEEEPLFGNCLAFHFARFPVHAAESPQKLAGDIRRELAHALRDGHVEANRVGMDFLRLRPMRLLLREMNWARGGGDAFSFSCADTGSVIRGPDSFFGRATVDMFHLADVLPRPGLGVFFSRRAQEQSLTVAWAGGVLEEPEAQRIHEIISSELKWVPRR
jgi:hypothetical protein